MENEGKGNYVSAITSGLGKVVRLMYKKPDKD